MRMRGDFLSSAPTPLNGGAEGSPQLMVPGLGMYGEK